MGWKQSGGSRVDIQWDEAKTIEGIYRGGEEVTTDYGDNIIHTIEHPHGLKETFFGTKALNSRLEDTPPGTRIRIEYTGKMRKSARGQQYKDFKVSVWEDEGEGEVGTSAPAPPVHQETPTQPTPVGPPPQAPAPPATGAPAKTLPPLPPNVENLRAQCREYVTVLKISKAQSEEIWRAVGSDNQSHEDWKRAFVVLYSMNNGMTQAQAIIAALQAFPREQDGADDVPF